MRWKWTKRIYMWHLHLLGKTEKTTSPFSVGSALPSSFLNRSRDCSVYTPLEDGVLRRTPAQMFQRT